jgi:TonB family protein
MAMREEFDQYLLLKKLAEDPLGETFRAGRIGNGSLDQVVLLRVLNGPRVNTNALADQLAERGAVQQALKSPNIGNGVGVGTYRGVPYLAYDYISGRNLASLIQQADLQLSPITSEHALLIAERIGLALAVAYETRVGGERLSHGFLLPHLVRISNEGETRVLGFEAGPLLAEQAAGGTFEPEVSAYLAPELVAGKGFDKSDDVYSLGAILYELLTGVRYTGNRSTIRTATLAGEGTAPPAPVVELLEKSLAPRGERIAEPVSWHKALTRVMQEGGYSATTFNLAFFMHNLFRSDIEQEAQEMEAEKNIEPPVPAATTMEVPREHVKAALAGAGASGAAGVAAGDATGTTHVQTTEKKGGKGALLGIAAVLLLALIGGGIWFMTQGGDSEAEIAAAAAPPPAPVEPEPQGPTAEELEAQLQQMIEARSAEMEEKLKEQYDQRIQSLQGQLQDTQSAAAEREAARRAEIERRESERAAALAAEQKAAQAEETRQKQEAEAARKKQEEAARKKQEEEAARKAEIEAATQAQAQVQPAVVRPPELVRRPEPRYPDMAKRAQRSRADVLLRVLVDERGRVTQVEQISKKVGFGIDSAAASAAKQAQYNPGTSDGKPQEMWTVLRFTFEP